MGSLRERVRQFLSEHGIRLRKKLGQHFLVDEGIVETIVETARIGPGDHIVEIGPGIGILTEKLLERAGHVTAIELDQRMTALLQTYISTAGRKPATGSQKHQGTIIHGNALSIPFPDEPYKIVANIPYHITSPLLRHSFLDGPRPPETLTLLIQREVAEKICDVKHASMLTIIVGLFGRPQLVLPVAPEAFLPPPKVDSAVLHIECFQSPLAGGETLEHVFRLTKSAFGQKRKMLRNSIGKLPGGTEMLELSGIDPERRPETLSVEEWIKVARQKV